MRKLSKYQISRILYRGEQVRLTIEELEEKANFILSGKTKITKECSQCGEIICECKICEICFHYQDEDGRCNCTAKDY